MSVLRDEITDVREKLNGVRSELADLHQQLAVIPGWLWVGDPSILDDEGRRLQAETAHNLLDGIANAERQIQELRVDLDVLDSEPPASWSPNPPDAGRRIGVLLPLRLETRFTPPNQDARPGDPDTKWKLRVRVEPDPVSIATPPSEVVQREADLVAECWKRCEGDLTGEAGAAAFGVVAGQVGAPRAAYLLRTVQVVPNGSGFRHVGIYPERNTPASPLLGLPAVLEIWGQDADGMRRLMTLNPKVAAIADQSRLDTLFENDATTRKLTWWNSYDVAKDLELAGQIELSEARPHFDVLMCVGLDKPGEGNVAPAVLFGAHADAGRVGTLAPLTPTNTVAGQPTTDLGRDPQMWLEVARGPAGAVGGLAAALTGQPTLAGVPVPDLSRQTAATALIRALWPVLWQRSLKDVAGLGPEIFRLGDWASRHLHPFGPFPVIRVGHLPYGVLPIADFDRWKWRPADPITGYSDPVVERPMAEILNHLIDPLVGAAQTRGTAAGADAERLLEVLANVPVTREYGSRNLVPTVILAALLTALGAEVAAGGPQEVIRQWDEQADYVRRMLREEPLRKYSPVLAVEAWPRKVATEYREVLKKYLESNWNELAEAGDTSGHWDIDGERPPVLARLVRHSLLLTQAELGRAWTPPQPVQYLLPLHDADQLYDDAGGNQFEDTGQVADVPSSVAAAAGAGPLDALTTAILRQFEDVRTAVHDGLVAAELEPVVTALPAVLDTAGHRLDAWFTALASRRLGELTRDGVPPVIGAYGWVDDLEPSKDTTPPTTAGLLHAPGYSQALASAVLRDHAVHDPDDTRWQIALHSSTIRVAATLAEQVRSGVHLSEALGREIERLVGEPGHVLDLRKKFPARPEWEGRRVSDGQLILDATRDDPLPELLAKVPDWMLPEYDEELSDLRHALDTYADLLVADALHDVVDGRPASAAEALEAAAGLGAPPELRLLRTQREGGTVRTKVMVALPWDPAKHAAVGDASPAYVADPAVSEWLEAELGPPADWVWTDTITNDPGITLLEALAYGVSDVLSVSQDELAREAAMRLGIRRDKVKGPVQLARARVLVSAVGAAVVDPANHSALLERLTKLRAMAATLKAALEANVAGSLDTARRWALPIEVKKVENETEAEHAAAVAAAMTAAGVALGSRLAAIGDASTDATASTDELAHRIRTLLPTTMALPLVCPAVLPVLHHDTLLDTEWLPVVAAVRPAMAGLEVVQLTSEQPWKAALSDDSSIWAPPPISQHGVAGDRPVTVVYGPGLGANPAAASGTMVGLATVDSWAETVPAGRHTTWASFGYDAPRARAPQAVLFVVPPDSTRPLSDEDVRGAVLQARKLARARAVTPPTPDDLALTLPTGFVLATTTTACVLTEEPS